MYVSSFVMIQSLRPIPYQRNSTFNICSYRYITKLVDYFSDWSLFFDGHPFCSHNKYDSTFVRTYIPSYILFRENNSRSFTYVRTYDSRKSITYCTVRAYVRRRGREYPFFLEMIHQYDQGWHYHLRHAALG